MTQNKTITLTKLEKYALDKLDVKLLKKWITLALTRFKRYDQYLLRKQLQVKIDAALAKVSDKSTKELYNAVLTNQLNYCLNSLSFGERNVQSILTEMDIAINSIGAYSALSNFVGVQPMQGPVGLVYTMQYKKNENDRLELTVLSNAIEAGSRRLQAVYTHEAMQDLATQHDLDMSQELPKLVGQMIGEEHISEIIGYMIKAADVTPVEPIDKGDLLAYSASTLNNLVIEIIKRSNQIAANTKRGAANFIITSPVVVSMLQAASHGKFSPPRQNHDKNEFDYAIKYAGILNESIHVYMSMDPKIIDESLVLLGYKGNSGEVDAGLIFAPYVPVMSTGIIVNQKTFQPQTNLMTRYGLHALVSGTDDKSENTTQCKNYYSAFSAKAFMLDNILLG